MLLILIPAIWCAIAVFVAVLCRMAARGDIAVNTPAESETGLHTTSRLTLFEDAPLRPAHENPRDDRIGRRVVAAGSSQERRARCLTG